MKLQAQRIFIALATLSPAGAMADITIYGKANLSFEHVSDGDESFTEVVSNASRLGFKGSEKINDALEAIYQLEYEIDTDDADTFRQRNIFVGAKGGFGQIIGGHFDTPLKNAQGKVDVFNDLRGDIKNVITSNDNRTSNTVMYSTPSLSGFVAHAAYISSEVDEVDNGKSLALTYTWKGFYFGAAFEQDVVQLDSETVRVAATYTLGGLQLGALYEEDELVDEDLVGSETTSDGWLASALYDFQNNWVIKAQFGESDIRFESGDTASVGVDYKATKNFTVYSFYTANSSDSLIAEDKVDQDYVGLGVDLKF